MVKSENIAKYIDKFALKRFWIFIAESGIIYAFGFLGIYYLYRNDKNRYRKMIFWQIVLSLIGLFFSYNIYKMLGLMQAIITFIIFNLSGFALFGLYLLFYYSLSIIINYFNSVPSCPGVAPVIPGIDIPNVPISVPFFEGWLAIFIILVSHELAHGVLARVAKIKVKSFGLLLLGYLPIGAFTEPDEKELVEAKDKDQLRVYSAGASINLYLAGLFFIISLLLVAIFSGYISNINKSHSDGLYISNFSEYTALCSSNIKSKNYGLYDSNLKIIEVEGHKISDLNDFYFVKKNSDDLNKLSMLFKVQDSNGKVYDINLLVNDDKKLGINIGVIKRDEDEISVFYKILEFILSLLSWLVILNLGIALVNFLPSEPFDGGKMSKIIIGDVFMKKLDKSRRHKLIGTVFAIIVFLLIIINLLPLFF